MLKFVLPVSALALAACAVVAGTSTQTASAAPESRALEGRAIGEPTDCITSRDIEDTDAVSDRVVLFHMRNGRTYRNDLPESCRQLTRKSSAFSYRTTVDRLCSIDVIRVFEPAQGIALGGCRLGKFVPYELPEGTNRNSF